jgi:hypothetical protein
MKLNMKLSLITSMLLVSSLFADSNVSVSNNGVQTEPLKTEQGVVQSQPQQSVIAEQKEPEKVLVKNEFKLTTAEKARNFGVWIKKQDHKNIILHLNDLNLEGQTINIDIPTKFLCDETEIKNGILVLNADTSFEGCVFTNEFLIENNKFSKITKSLGNLRIKGTGVSIDKVKLDSLEFLSDVRNTTITNAKIGKIIDYGSDYSNRTNDHFNILIQDSFVSEYVYPYLNEKGEEKNQGYLRLNDYKIINSEISFGTHVLFNSGYFLNSSVKFISGSFGSNTINIDFINSYIQGQGKGNYRFGRDFKGCMLHNNISVNGEFESSTKVINNIIDANKFYINSSLDKTLLYKRNVLNINDQTKSLVKYNGLALSSETIQDSYVSVGKDVSNALSDCVHYTENKELYMKYFYYDKNGKKRDIKSPTLGQYEPTINEIKATESDFK